LSIGQTFKKQNNDTYRNISKLNKTKQTVIDKSVSPAMWKYAY